ncbi:MAG: polysaccharide deacetylase family protein [bacterium]
MRLQTIFIVIVCAILFAILSFAYMGRSRGHIFSSLGYGDEYFVTTHLTPIPLAQIIEKSSLTVQSATSSALISTPSASFATPSSRMRIPIITYHYVEYVKNRLDTTRIKLTINPRLFEEQLKSLHDGGVQTYFIKEIPSLLKGDLVLATKSAVLTFDDGYRDFYTDAFPVLKKYQMKGTIFLISSFLGRNDFLTLEQVTEMLDSGLIEVGSHTLHHANLKKANLSYATDEIVQSKANLEKLFGISVESFAYPYGAFDDQAVRLVKEASYSAAVSTVSGVHHTLDDLYTLKRWRAGVLQGTRSADILDALQ